MILMGNDNNIHPTCVLGGKGFSFTKTLPRKQSDSKDLIIGENNYVAGLCVIELGVNRDTIIGNNNIIDSFVIIGHDVHIGNNCEIDAGARILGGVTIGDNCRICTNAILHPDITIGKNSVVGAGSYCRMDVPDNTIVYGTPAKVVENSKYGRWRYGD